MATYKTMAIRDDVNSCDCCGKAKLKSTVEMQRSDGEIFHFGSVCATRHSGREAKVIRNEADEVLNQRKNTAAAEYATAAAGAEAAYSAKSKEAFSRRYIGREFADFCRNERDACDTIRQQISDKYNLEFHAF